MNSRSIAAISAVVNTVAIDIPAIATAVTKDKCAGVSWRRYGHLGTISREQKPMDILINEQKLSDVNSMPQNKPKEIIGLTKGATVNGNEAKVKDVTENSITLEVSDLGHGPYLIVLTKEPSGGKILALLGYDPNTETLLPKKEEDQIYPYNEIVEAINHVAKAIEETEIKKGFDQVADAIGETEIKKGFDQVADAIEKKKAGR